MAVKFEDGDKVGFKFFFKTTEGTIVRSFKDKPDFFMVRILGENHVFHEKEMFLLPLERRVIIEKHYRF